MKTRFIISAVFLCITIHSYSQTPDTVKFISLKPQEFMQALAKDSCAVLFDVREYFEYRKNRLKTAKNLPSSGKFETAADTLNKASPLYFYCTSGFRSKRVAKNFYDRGFLKTYSLDGGITAWKKADMPVDKKHLKKHKK